MLEITEIRKFRPCKSVFSADEKIHLINLVQAVAASKGLGAALSALWEQQKAIGFILGEPSVGENLTDKTKFLSKKRGRYWLIHSPARKDRRNVLFLTARGILRENPTLVYEKLEGGIYEHYPAKRHGFDDICFLCSAQSANPNEVLIPMELAGAEFIYGANFATLGFCHFTFWTRVPILQKYWPEDTLLWLAEHSRILSSSKYTTFFNGLGAGNSIKHFHYQTLRESFPIFQTSVSRHFQQSGIVRLEWPMPAYRITITSQQNPIAALLPMDNLIQEWLAMDKFHTFNLIQTSNPDGTADFAFIPRVDSETKRRPSSIANDFAGCEVGGRINIENREEWEWASKQTELVVGDLLASLAPIQEKITALEEQL